MKIERITLTNFRQYYGDHRLRLSLDPERNITVIHGVNGAGKTSLFLALNWCLYGEGVDNIGQIISKEAVSRAKQAEIVTTKVAIYFLHEGQRYVASRQLQGQKQKDGSVLEARTNTEFMLMRTPTSGIAERSANPIGMINTILPSNVRTYFFFDGEKIDNFARPEHAEEVRFAIYQVLNLETLTRAVHHLAVAARDLRGDLKNIATGELQDLVDQDVRERETETALALRKDNLREEIAAAQRHMEEINQRLRDFDEAQALQKQYDLLSEQLNERQQELNGLTGRIREIANAGYIPVSRNAVQIAISILDEKRQRGEIPSNIRQQFIEDLLARQMCICGRPFSEHDEAYGHLVGLLRSAVPTSLEDDVLTTTGNLRSLVERGEQHQADLNTVMGDRVRLQQAVERLHAQRDDIQRQMKGADQAEVSDLAKKREKYQADIDDYRTEQVRVDMELEEVRKRIKELERQIELARKTDNKARVLARKVELAQKSSDVINKVYETFAESKRLEIERETRGIFGSLAWKGEHFQDVRLTPDYQLEVIDRYGLPARPDLSAGERQVLSLSFITAMAKVAQREAPLIMDTPFGRLSSAHRETITANLPNLAPQLVLFVTDEELRDRALENLAARIGTEYRLNFNPHTSCTTIEELM
jgi:DNA sulfur modification protein DndD